jgi:hypothetical protein
VCVSVCGPAPLLGCRPIRVRVRVESLYICVPHLLSIYHFYTSISKVLKLDPVWEPRRTWRALDRTRAGAWRHAPAARRVCIDPDTKTYSISPLNVPCPPPLPHLIYHRDFLLYPSLAPPPQEYLNSTSRPPPRWSQPW